MTSESSPERISLLESYSRPGSALRRYEMRAMGTWNVLLLSGAPEAELQASAQEAFDCMVRLEQSLSKFLPDSDLSLLNVLGATRPVAVGEDIYVLLQRAR